MRKAIATDQAPAAIGPYSQAIEAGGTLWVSGQISLDRRTGQVLGETAAAQAEHALRNLGAVLRAGGCDFSDLVKCSIFLMDMGDFAAVNEIYARFMPDPPPARETVQVSGLPKGVRVEISAVACCPR